MTAARSVFAGLQRLARDPAWARARVLVGSIVGLALFIAALVVLAREGVKLADLWARLRTTPAPLLVLACTLPLANWLTMCACFWVLMRRDAVLAASAASRPLTLASMVPILGLTWLLNYLPMRPGLFGRLAFHRAVNAIPLTASIQAVVANLIAGASAIAITALAVALAAPALAPHARAWILIPALPTLALLLASRFVGPRLQPLFLATAIRQADLFIWAARYLVVFAIINQPITLPAALAAAAASQAVSVIPFSGNGLGLREWVVGLLMPVLPAALLASSVTREHALTADILNRAAETLAVIPVGLISALIITRWLHALPNARSQLSRAPHQEITRDPAPSAIQPTPPTE